MAFSDQVAAMQASIYALMGVPATWTAPEKPAIPLMVLPDKSGSALDAGGGWDARPGKTPSNVIRIRTSDLTTAGLMTPDAASRAPVPAWQGVTVNMDGVERKIVDKPQPADDLRRLEWVFNLA